MAGYARDAADLVTALDWKNPLVVGVSFGGMVAQELMLNYPGLVKRAALLCTSSGGAGGDSYPLHELYQLPVPERALKLLEQSDLRWTKTWQTENRTLFDPLLKQRTEEMQKVEENPELKVGAIRQLEARRLHNTWDRLPHINTPVGIFGGHHDGIARPDNLKALRKQIPNAQMALFEGGHFFFLQDQQAWPTIIQFLKQ